MAVQFEEQKSSSLNLHTKAGAGPVVRIIMALGLAKTPLAAQTVMLLIILLSLAGAVYVYIARLDNPAQALAPDDSARLESELDILIRSRNR